MLDSRVTQPFVIVEPQYNIHSIVKYTIRVSLGVPEIILQVFIITRRRTVSNSVNEMCQA